MSYFVLLAESDARGLLDKIFDPRILPIFIPIVAIVGGIGYANTAAIIRHRERMVRITATWTPMEKAILNST